MELLRIEGLTKAYPRFTLDKVSFSLDEGRIMGLIGKNGAGKSTTLKAMLRMVSPDSGTITILGKDFLKEESACKQEMGIVLGGIDYYPQKQLKTITAVTRRFYKEWDDSAYRRYLKLFELEEEKKVTELSAGMRVKYLIALALSHHARLLLFDEPTSGLDPVARDELLTIFKKLVSGGKRAILYSTHITTDLEKCADDITYLNDGKLLASAPKAEFLKAFQYLRTKEDPAPLTLEEIMVRTQRKEEDYDGLAL